MHACFVQEVVEVVTYPCEGAVFDLKKKRIRSVCRKINDANLGSSAVCWLSLIAVFRHELSAVVSADAWQQERAIYPLHRVPGKVSAYAENSHIRKGECVSEEKPVHTSHTSQETNLRWSRPPVQLLR